MALLYAPSDDPLDAPSVGSEHCYNEARNGRLLTGVEKEWADEYAANLTRESKYEHHLRAAGALGYGDALLELAERFDESTFFEQACNLSPRMEPARIAEIAEDLGRNHDERKWLAEAARQGDTEAMRNLIEGYDRNDLQQCWTWFYLAKLLGTDLSEDRYEAIRENGSRYDDDVGCTLFAVGDDGLELELIDEGDDAAARKAAAVLYQAIERRGED